MVVRALLWYSCSEATHIWGEPVKGVLLYCRCVHLLINKRLGDPET